MKFPQGFPSMSGAGGYWDRFINGDDSFHNVIKVLDFPLESVEEDNSVAENWESQFQSLGPYSSETLQGLAPVFNSVTDNLVQVMFPSTLIGTGQKLDPDENYQCY